MPRDLLTLLAVATLALCGFVVADGAPPTPAPPQPSPPRRPRYTIKINANDSPTMTREEIKRLHPISPGSGPVVSPPSEEIDPQEPQVYTLSNPPPAARPPSEASNPPVPSSYLTEGELYGDWIALRESCVTVSAGEGSNARWRLCPFANLTRFDAETGEATVLGVWREWSVADDGHLAMVFDDGCPCEPSRGAADAASEVRRHSVRVMVSCRVEDVFSHPDTELMTADDDWSYDEALVATTSFTRPEPKPSTEPQGRPDRCSLTATLALPSISYLCGGPRRPILSRAARSGSPSAVAELKAGRDPTAAAATALAAAARAASAARVAADSAAAAPSEGGADGDDILFSDSDSSESGVGLPAAAAAPARAAPGFQLVPTSLPVCRDQHSFLAAEVAAMARCIDEWAAAAAAWARLSIPSHDPRTGEDLKKEMSLYEKRMRSEPDGGGSLSSPVGQVLSQLVRVPVKCVEYVSREKAPETIFFTPEQLQEGQDMLAAAGL